MRASRVRCLLVALVAGSAWPALGQGAATPPATSAPVVHGTTPMPNAGSTAFCLFELPADGSGRRRFINLGIVQYVDVVESEVRIAYGGGNFGAGHDANVPTASTQDAIALIERMKRTAAACALRPLVPITPVPAGSG